jgi:hypothetical protein
MKMKKLVPTVLIILLFLAYKPISAQIDKMKDLMDDEMTEEEDGMATLRFFDALDGSPVGDATIAIDGIGEFTSDGIGRVRFESPESDAVYAFKFSKEGYITADFSFEVIVGTIFYNRFTVSPIIDMGSIRIVLEWDRRPDDLDLHLQKTGSYHISFHDKIASNDGMVRLDLDAMKGYGPETITIKNVDDNAEYLCYVHDYSNKNHPKSKTLSRSKARILVYGEGQLLHIYEMNEVQRGNKWNVFRLVKGQFVVENEVKRVR